MARTDVVMVPWLCSFCSSSASSAVRTTRMLALAMSTSRSAFFSTKVTKMRADLDHSRARL